MSRFFPHAPYAEDQALAKTILTTHVLTRAVTTGAIIGLGIFTTRSIVSSLGTKSTPAGVAPTPTPFPKGQGAALAALLRSTGTSTAITVGIVSLGLVGRMWGREHIEWQDRSWRLRENAGQLETDDWTYAGMAAGLAALAAGRGVTAVGWKGVLGAAGTGSVVGTIGYMAWRYGVHGGKFPARN